MKNLVSLAVEVSLAETTSRLYEVCLAATTQPRRKL